jgi:hypothetical protein
MKQRIHKNIGPRPLAVFAHPDDEALCFQGTDEFTRALPPFAVEATTPRYTSDHVAVEWFPSGSHIVEQNERGTNLYLILSGHTDVIQEDADGIRRTLGRLGPGEFFGELAIVHQQLRAAHVVASGDVTCLVLAPSAPSPFARRGADAGLLETDMAGRMVQEPPAVRRHLSTSQLM